MSGVSSDLESLFADFVAAHVLDGRRLAAEELCGARPHLIDPLNDLINRYLSITTALDDAESAEPDREAGSGSPLPRFEGFHTIERLGVGGMGEVFKLRDLSLDRVVAAKVMRRDSRASVTPPHSCRKRGRWRSSPTGGSSESSRSGRLRIRRPSSWSSSRGSSSDGSAHRSNSGSARG
jgi:hypothetical protein